MLLSWSIGGKSYWLSTAGFDSQAVVNDNKHVHHEASALLPPDASGLGITGSLPTAASELCS